MADFLENNSDSDLDIKINKNYADRYNTWREKEEFQKLKNKYGEDAVNKLDDNDESSSDEENENAKELTEEFERDFLKTLSYLKKKDPCIYDKDTKFFEEYKSTLKQDGASVEKSKKKEKSLFLRDYERKLILEKGGKFTDDEEEDGSNVNQKRPPSPTLVEEELAIRDSFKNVLNDDDEDVNNLGGLFQKRQKSKQELEKDNANYLEWLKGQKEELLDKKMESELKPLHDFWNDPQLDESEQFLRDYILNQKFLETEDDDHIPTYEEIVHDSDEGLSGDEHTLGQQEEFERKFNFRFEEPDSEFTKRYPRVMEHSLRKKDDRRKLKREELKKRKQEEKVRKREELKRLRAMKRKEIETKLEKLKEITGNAELGFKDEDLEGEFNPAEYDKRMKELFSDEFYKEEDYSQKPEFPDIDEELEIENWERWRGEVTSEVDNGNEYQPHCEDPDFNMDCDYDPKAQFQAELIETTRRRKKGRRRSKLAQLLAKKKPIFEPNERTFDEYVNEYYKMDFEDVIGDLPCRFKYRNVVPNSFGLTTDEILSAKDKELNQWVSLGKAVQYRPETKELYDVKAYQNKAKNIKLKEKCLASLYSGEKNEEKTPEPGKKKKKRKRKKSSTAETSEKAFKIQREGEVGVTLTRRIPGEKRERRGNSGRAGPGRIQNSVIGTRNHLAPETSYFTLPGVLSEHTMLIRLIVSCSQSKQHVRISWLCPWEVASLAELSMHTLTPLDGSCSIGESSRTWHILMRENNPNFASKLLVEAAPSV
uniref:Protein KRI1 homolog n=1 Tax=Timema monikensis TaxID=170555 RepID=A0A7R9EFL5_9NEOP|nr:unnamed protein product [Timema monikensis]